MKILITGASKGIGKYLMTKFQKSANTVYGTYNTTLPENNSIFLSKVDVTNYNEVKAWVNQKVSGKDKIILINCAGTNYNSFAHKADIEKWKGVIDANLIGSFNAINAVLPEMREQNFGRIINFASIVAQKGIPGTSAYAASKAALWGMTKSIAAENASKGITINNLNLGYFDIGMITEVPEPVLDRIKKTIPNQKLGQPENIYNAIIFIIENEYLNGTSLDINGGLF